MKIGASSFAGSLPELINEVDSVELYIPKLGVYEGTALVKSSIKKLTDTLSTADLATSIHAPYFGDGPNYPKELMIDTAVMNDTQERLLQESIMIAQELDSEVVVIHPGRIGASRERSFAGMVSGLTRLADFAQDRGVMIGLENKEATDPYNLCCSARDLIDAIKCVGSSNLMATFDIGHANLTCGGCASSLRDFARKIRDYVIHVHVHDNSGQWTEKYCGDFHGAPGTGVIDFSVLNEFDFEGIYNLEVFSIDAIRKGKQVLQNITGKAAKKSEVEI